MTSVAEAPFEAPAGGAPLRARRWWVRPAGLLVAAAAVIAGVTLGVLALGGEEPPRTYRYEIPEGTAIRQGFGERLDVMPNVLEVHVGDRLVIVNDDTQMHVAGPFSIRPGETFRYRFTAKGILQGVCTFNGEQELEVRVT